METAEIMEKDRALQADVRTLQQILFQISWASQRRLARELDEYHLTLPQYSALRALRRSREGLRMNELASAAQQVSATMTGIIDRLSENGLVERRLDPEDRRAWRVYLTVKGEQLLDEFDAHNQTRLAKMMAGLSARERDEMIHLMQRYLDTTLAEIEDSENEA